MNTKPQDVVSMTDIFTRLASDDLKQDISRFFEVVKLVGESEQSIKDLYNRAGELRFEFAYCVCMARVLDDRILEMTKEAIEKGIDLASL
jgi:hypothetical protein